MRPFLKGAALSKFELTPAPAYDRAPSVSVIDDEIVVVGPGSIAFSMTRDAALETYRRLGAALAVAPGGEDEQTRP
jgi:hypothetical protein